MASASSINGMGQGNIDHHHMAPNPPPRTHPRPNQPPPPPPPLPSVPPVPPTRDSSIAISKSAIINNKPSNVSLITQQISPMANNRSYSHTAAHLAPNETPTTIETSRFSDQFLHLFKPLDDLPPPEPFMNKPKTYPSQKAQRNHQSNDAARASSHPTAR